MDIEKELDELRWRKWHEFQNDYPITCSRSFFARILRVFKANEIRVVWENGFYKGAMADQQLHNKMMTAAYQKGKQDVLTDETLP